MDGGISQFGMFHEKNEKKLKLETVRINNFLEQSYCKEKVKTQQWWRGVGSKEALSFVFVLRYKLTVYL